MLTLNNRRRYSQCRLRLHRALGAGGSLHLLPRHGGRRQNILDTCCSYISWLPLVLPPSWFWRALVWFLPMYLFRVFVELSLHGFHCNSRIADQSGPGRTKVRGATRALSVQPRLVVLGDLKYWLFHAASFPRTLVPYQPRNSIRGCELSCSDAISGVCHDRFS